METDYIKRADQTGYALLGGTVADHTPYELSLERRDILKYAGFADREYTKTDLFFSIHQGSEYMRGLPEVAQDDLGNVVLDIVEHMVKNGADKVRFLNVRLNMA